MKPNILFFCADEHTRGALGCYGAPFIKAPNLDRLAASGCRFAAAYTNSPLCVPARAAMITGRYVHQIGCWDNGHPYHGTPIGWAHLLRHRGYRTVSIGKNHFRSTDDDNGFDEEHLPMHVRWGIGDLFGMLRKERATYPNLGADRKTAPNDPSKIVFGPAMMAEVAGSGETNHTEYDRQITAAACRWLAQDAPKLKGEPWALYVSMVAPHFPLVAPKKFYDLYRPESLPWPIHYEKDERPKHPVVRALMEIWNYDDFFNREKLLRARAGYYGLISYLDDNIGQILNALDQQGFRNDTLIVYTSDHGEMLGNKGIWSTSALYEDSAGIPLLLSGPGVPKGRTVVTPVSHVDILPTLLEASGGLDEAQNERPGRALNGLIRREEPTRYVFSEYHAGGSITGCFMVRFENWKYIHYTGYEPELYDLAADPHEGNDLSGDPAYRQIRYLCERLLRSIVDPKKATELAFADQVATVARHGGVDAVRRRGHPGEHSMDRNLGVE